MSQVAKIVMANARAQMSPELFAAISEMVESGEIEPIIIKGEPGFQLTDLGRARRARERGQLQ